MINQPHFDGVTYDPERDHARLTGQKGRVYDAIKVGGWFTLEEISMITGDPESSVSARLRDLRKPKFGSHNIERKYVRRGLHIYRMVLPECSL